MARHQLVARKRQPLPGTPSSGTADPMQRFEVRVLVRGRQSDLAQITDFATGHGLEIIQNGGARPTAILGTAAQFNDAFGVKLGSGPPQLIEMTAGLLVASWGAVTASVERMLPWRKDSHALTAATSGHEYRIARAAENIFPTSAHKIPSRNCP